MSSSEVEELRNMIKQLDAKIDKVGGTCGALETKVDAMLVPLRRFASHYHVDNPPGRWRGLGRALAAFARPTNNEQTESTDAK